MSCSLLRRTVSLVIALWYLGASAEKVSCDLDNAAQSSSSLLQRSAGFGRSDEALPEKISMAEKRICDLQEIPISTTPPKSFEHFVHIHSGYSGLYVNKSAKFAFCLIEKNACSSWSAIFNKLHTGNPNVGNNHLLVEQTFSAQDALDVFQDPTATRAVFVRDPLERFLSAFFNKCADPNSCDNGFCFMRWKNQTGSPIPFSQAVEWIKLQNTSQLDGHWGSQSQHCELHSRLHEYTILGVMKSNSLAEQAVCLLERAGLSHLNSQGDKFPRKVFTEGTRMAWVRKTEVEVKKEAEILEHLKSYYTREAAETVYNMYKEDYALFKLPRPDWIDDAHGRLFHDSTSAMCEDGRANFYTRTKLSDDDADIM